MFNKKVKVPGLDLDPKAIAKEFQALAASMTLDQKTKFVAAMGTLGRMEIRVRAAKDGKPLGISIWLMLDEHPSEGIFICSRGIDAPEHQAPEAA
jgi:hypothetical protein